jgi:hypothetical protein
MAIANCLLPPSSSRCQRSRWIEAGEDLPSVRDPRVSITRIVTSQWHTVVAAGWNAILRRIAEQPVRLPSVATALVHLSLIEPYARRCARKRVRITSALRICMLQSRYGCKRSGAPWRRGALVTNKKLSRKQRTENARNAARVRWGKKPVSR